MAKEKIKIYYDEEKEDIPFPELINYEEIISDISTIGNPTIIGGEMVIGSENNIFRVSSKGIHLGHSDFDRAPFRVDMTGALAATDITISSLTWNRAATLYSFESIDGWQTAAAGVGAIILPQAGRIVLRSGNEVNSITRITALWHGLSTFLSGTTDANPFVQCQAIISNSATATGDGSFFIGYGSSDPFSTLLSTSVFGFEWNYIDSRLYAVTKKSGLAAVKREITGVDVTSRRIYRVVVLEQGSIIRFYIDNVLRITASDPTFSIDTDFGPTIAVRTEVLNHEADLIVGNLFVSQDF